MKLSHCHFKPLGGSPLDELEALSMSLQHCGELFCALNFCPSVLSLGLQPDWPVFQLPKYSPFSIVPRHLHMLALSGVLLSYFFWLIPHLWGFSLEDTSSKSLLSSPKSWVFSWWTHMGAQCFHCSAHHSVESDRLFPPLTFSLDFTLHESRNYVSFNSVAPPGASTLWAWHLQDSQ